MFNIVVYHAFEINSAFVIYTNELRMCGCAYTDIFMCIGVYVCVFRSTQWCTKLT